MRTWVGLLLLAFAAAVGSTFMPQIRVYGGMPDLVFLIVLSMATANPLERCVTWALFGGICQDLLSVTPTGASAVGLVTLVFIVEWLRGQVFRLGLLTLIVVVLSGTAVHKGLLLTLSALVGLPIRPLDAAVYVILPTMVYNLIFLFPIYWVVRAMSRRRAIRERIS
jgi:rod shape-determining protein MreD